VSASSFAWLDYDEGDRRRMAEVVNLFREQGTLDELGIGQIRDTFADLFFPGTSTIQTRARCFLFVPWLFILLANERISSERAERRVRELHGRLVQSLREGEKKPEDAGIIGIEAGEHIQRLPNSIYWQGLSRWGIRLFSGSAERFAASIAGPDVKERAARTSDGGELLVSAHRHWHPSLPRAPDGFLTETSFALTGDEAEFLAERIRHACGDSLLAACLTPAVTRKRDALAPWELGGLDSLPIE
jgi:hypothetical protein